MPIPLKHKLKSSQGEIDHLNRPIYIEENEVIINSLLKKKSPWPGGFPGGVYQTFKGEIMPIFHNLFKKIEAEGPLSNSFHEVSLALISKWNKDVTRKETTHQYLSQIVNPIQQYRERIIYPHQVGFIAGMQVWFNSHISINILHHIYRLKKKNHDYTVDKKKKKAFWKNPISIQDKKKSQQNKKIGNSLTS